jgi:tetratricopeptide (TPR) repeat protein
VIGRTSSFQFKGRHEDVRAIGEQLGVANVLEGSVQKLGDRVRVNAQLVSASNGSEVWADSYERDLGNAFAIQDDIVGDVVKALRIELLDPDAQRHDAPSDPEAYTLALKGRYFLHRNTRKDLRKAAAFYREAIALAPDYAPAWAGLSGVYYAQTSYDHLPVAIGLKAMRATAARALALDPDLTAGHHMLAAIRKDYDWDWAAAEQSIDRAQALSPGDPAVLRQAGTLRMIRGHFDEAIALYQQSLDLDPLELTTLNNLAIAQYYAGHVDAAASTIDKLVELNPQSDGASYFQGLVALAQGHPREALVAFEREPDGLWKLQGQALAHHALGQPDASNAALSKLTERFSGDSAFQIAEVHAFRGDNDAAFAWLERAYAQRDGGLSEIKGDPLLRNLESDPRHAAFLQRMRLL